MPPAGPLTAIGIEVAGLHIEVARPRVDTKDPIGR